MITTMYDTAAIFRREFTARRGLLWAAVYIAVLIVVFPLTPFISTIERTDVRDLMSVASALGAAVALSIGLGATFFGRDLSEGRLGFYFERPVRSVAVWAGRFLAVLTVVVLFEVVTLLPARLSSSDGLTIMVYVGWPKSFGVAGWAVALVAGPAFLLLLAHAVGVMVRARTAWLLLDVVGFTATVVIAWLSLQPFIVGDFSDALLAVSLAVAASALVALLAGFAAGVHSGRCDLGRVHRALSVTMWCVVAITFGGVAAYSAWLEHFEPSELGEFDVGPTALNGRWIEVRGTSPGRLDVERHFLVSTTDSRWLRVPTPRRDRWWSVSFSEDGSRAFWLDGGRGEQPSVVNYVGLDGAVLEPVATSILIDSDASYYPSPGGSRLAVEDEGILSVYDVESERLLTAVRLPEELHEASAIFVAESTIRMYRRSGEPGHVTYSISEVDTDTGSIRNTGSFVAGFEYFWTAWDADLGHVAISAYRETGDDRWIGNIFDARTGDFIRPIVDFAAFLHDGRVLKVLRDGYDPKSIVIEDRTRENSVELDLPDVPDLSIIGEGPRGHLLLSHSPDFAAGHRSDQIDLFDLETGVTEKIGDGLRPVFGYSWADGSGWFRRTPESSLLFWQNEGTLVRWDPERGELVTVIAGLDGS